MAAHSVAEAKDKLSSLIDRALAGEDVVITRHGRPVVELRAVTLAPSPVTAADADWLADRRKGLPFSPIDSATLVSRMRDEGQT